MRQIAIFASGSGSNFEAIALAAQTGVLNAKISLLVCDRPNAYVITRAERLGIPAFSFSPSQYAGKAAYETAILEQLHTRNVTFIALAGYMRIVGETLLRAYPNQIVNIHPSKLPDFPGKDAIARAYESGAPETGVSVHYVDAGIDTGPVIAQRTVEIAQTDTLESLTEKVHQVEHVLYIETLKRILETEEVTK